MNKKKIIIISIAIILILALGIITKVAIDFNKESKIRNEIKEIEKVFFSSDNTSINEILDRRIIKKGPYATVEESIKAYYKNLYSTKENIFFLLDDDNFSNYLSSKNLNDDKPLYVKSRSNLKNTKAQLDENYQKYLSDINETSNKLSYLTEKDLKSYYSNFYIELTENVITSESKEVLEKEYNKAINRINIYNEVYDFLSANKGHWAIKNDRLEFDDTLLYEEYINITDKLSIEETNANEVIE